MFGQSRILYRSDSWLQLAIGVGTLIVSLVNLAAIWFGIDRMLSSTSSAEAAYQIIMDQSARLDRMLIENVELSSYFLEGKVVSADDPNFRKVIALAEVRLATIDSVLAFAQTKHEENEIDGLIRKFVRNFRQSPAMCERLRANADHYGSWIVAIGKQACRPSP
jgi:hypothetical protein